MYRFDLMIKSIHIGCTGRYDMVLITLTGHIGRYEMVQVTMVCIDHCNCKSCFEDHCKFPKVNLHLIEKAFMELNAMLAYMVDTKMVILPFFIWGNWANQGQYWRLLELEFQLPPFTLYAYMEISHSTI